MNPHKTIIAGINFTVLDEKVVPYAALFQSIYKPEKLIFYHVASSEKSGSKIEETKQAVKTRVEELYGKTLPDSFMVLVESGNPEALLVKKSKDPDTDMLILGRKTHEKNKILTNKLINTAGCTLCLIPDHAVIKISSLAVAVDFSEESKNGLDAAVAIAEESGAKIHCLNVYTVPSGYHTIGKDYDEFAEIMKNNAKKAAAKFQKKFGYKVPLNFGFMLDDDKDPADKLYAFAKKNNADLVCVGSKGMSSFAAIFFDSTAEKIVEFSNNIPLLIVKTKNENRGFFDAIREQ